MTRTERAVLDLLANVAPAIISRSSRPGPHCVLATAIGQDVLRRLSIRSTAFPVALTLCNDAWEAWARAGHPGGVDEQRRRGAWMVTNEPGKAGVVMRQLPNPWDGHLVLRVERKIVDLDLGSMARPEHQMLVPGGAVFDLAPDRTCGGSYINADDGTKTWLCYRPLVTDYADGYLNAPDWIFRDRIEHIVNDIIEAMLEKWTADRC